MSPEERRDRWMVARARADVARQNAVRNRTGIRAAIDELDHYLDVILPAAGFSWEGTPLVFSGGRRPASRSWRAR